MFKLVSVLAAGMFLTFLIGGEDKGQVRQGLVGVSVDPAERPVVRAAVVPKPAARPAQKPAATLANFTPATVQPPTVMKSGTSVIAGPFVIVGQAKVEAVAAAVVDTGAGAGSLPVMFISSKSVNVRGGPSTDYEVVGRLARAEAVTVLEPEQDGWVRIAIEGDGLEGFIAARLLSDTDPSGN